MQFDAFESCIDDLTGDDEATEPLILGLVLGGSTLRGAFRVIEHAEGRKLVAGVTRP